MNPLLSVFDIVLPPIYLLIALAYGYYQTKKYIRTNPEYEYFTRGLMARIFGAISLGLVYFFYYGGGDTVNYFQTASAYSKLMFVNQEDFFSGLFGEPKAYLMHFDDFTGYPMYRSTDKHAFFVVRLLIPLMALGAYSYFASAIVIAFVTFGGLWKLYQTFLQEFPLLKKQFAISCLFIPSCVFWGSGLMKDSFTLSAVGWFTYAFYHFFIKKKYSPKLILILFLSAYVIIAIKPYIFFALMPGSIFWMSTNLIKKIRHQFIQIIAAPLLLAFGVIGGIFALQKMGDLLGDYKIDKVLDKAVVTQQDMKADYYGGNSYDIGDFDASVSGIILKAPTAIFAGIFRPGLWDVKNAVMLVSSLENTYLLILTIFLLIKLKLVGFVNIIRQNAFLLFSVMFSLFFAFSVGLTCANFGSLVRLRIPELPFFVSSIFILKHLYEMKSGKKMKF